MSAAERTPDQIRRIVKETYGKIAVDSTSCCAPGSCCGADATPGVEGIVFADDYRSLDGYVPEADLGLGCGLPTQYAGIEPGHVVIDLGSGAGNDAFVVRTLVGDSGRVIGVDMTPEMTERARANAAGLGLDNVEFRAGEIEALPVEDAAADVVISNCVLNLVPDKARAFGEIHRVLKPGGRFCVSDIVLDGELPSGLAKAAEMLAGCVSGAQQRTEYLATAEAAGFRQVEVKESKEMILPDALLKQYLDETAIASYRESGVRILSITLVGDRASG